MDIVFKVLLLAYPWVCQARIIAAPRYAGTSLADPMPSYYYTNIDGQPGTYSFGYDVSPSSGDTSFRTEERFPNGTVIGSYGYVDPFGRPHRYKYVADARGYRVMRDRSAEPPHTGQHHYLNRKPDAADSSITWSRPKAPYKKQHNKITGGYYTNHQSNMIHPPSYYATFD